MVVFLEIVLASVKIIIPSKILLQSRTHSPQSKQRYTNVNFPFPMDKWLSIIQCSCKQEFVYCIFSVWIKIFSVEGVLKVSGNCFLINSSFEE